MIDSKNKNAKMKSGLYRQYLIAPIHVQLKATKTKNQKEKYRAKLQRSGGVIRIQKVQDTLIN